MITKTVYVNNDQLNLNIDAYKQYYGMINKDGVNIVEENKLQKDMPSKKLSEKTLSKRFKYY